jgi:hypothetical protein
MFLVLSLPDRPAREPKPQGEVADESLEEGREAGPPDAERSGGVSEILGRWTDFLRH